MKRLRAFLFVVAVAVSLSMGGAPPKPAEAGYTYACTIWKQSCTSTIYACYTGSDGRTYYCTSTTCVWVAVQSTCCGTNIIPSGGGLTGF